MRSLLVLITFSGLSLTFWGCIGACRLIHERPNHLVRPAIAAALATLLIALFNVLLLVLTLQPIMGLAIAVLARLPVAQPSTAGVFAMVVPTWIVLCGAATSYLGARLFEMRLFAGAALLLGAFYSLTMASLAQDILETGLAFYGRDMAPLVLLGLAIASCYLGPLLARRRARSITAAANAQGPGAPRRLTPKDVAVIVCAHNEETSIHACLDAGAKIVPLSNIFVGSDGSTDDTVQIARSKGCNVFDIQPNRGKARAILATLEHFAICDRFMAVLILDADSRLDEHYLEHALPLFDDPGVAAVAGHAIPQSYPHWLPRWSMFFIAYRIRLYRITQALLRYGQTWRHSNVSFIVPGFASMYRCSVLPKIDIAASGLVIEDFNMTFELHHKRLGRIAYTPSAICTSQEPRSLRDYTKQVRRWHLGFWQTVRRHGFWPSLFWLALGTFAAEMLLQSLAFLTVPFILVWFVHGAGEPVSVWLPQMGTTEISPLDVAVGVFLADYATTLLVSVLERKPILAVYGLGFFLLRWVDAFLFLYTLPLAFIEKSDGRWVSPTRSRWH